MTVAAGSAGASGGATRALTDWTSRQHLEELWQQSSRLRQHAMAARMTAMEARAIARDLRMQRQR